MSKATKRKHVTKEILEDYYVPEDGEEIVKIIGGRGNNLHEVQDSIGRQFLVSMPTKFRKNVWVKRGDFVVVTPIEEGVKVRGEIVYILYAKQIKYLKVEKLWPQGFNGEVKNTNPAQSSSEDINGNTKTEEASKPHPVEHDTNNDNADLDYDDDVSSDDDADLFENPNHRPTYYYEDDDSSEEEETSDEDEEQEEEEEKEESEDAKNNGEGNTSLDEGIQQLKL